jgi:hypothetical protein
LILPMKIVFTADQFKKYQELCGLLYFRASACGCGGGNTATATEPNQN